MQQSVVKKRLPPLTHAKKGLPPPLQSSEKNCFAPPLISIWVNCIIIATSLIQSTFVRFFKTIKNICHVLILFPHYDSAYVGQS